MRAILIALALLLSAAAPARALPDPVKYELAGVDARRAIDRIVETSRGAVLPYGELVVLEYPPCQLVAYFIFVDGNAVAIGFTSLAILRPILGLPA